MISYITILITAALGVIGLVAKSKKSDTDSGNLNKLTPFGVVILILLILALAANIFSRIKEDHKAVQDKANQLNQKRLDSIAAYNLILTDSLRHEMTINNFKSQSLLDLKKIEEDSIRYFATLSKIEQQLYIQRHTLNGIKIMSQPLFPMTISLSFEIDYSDFKAGNNTVLTSLLDNWLKNPIGDRPKYFDSNLNDSLITANWHDVTNGADSILLNTFDKRISEIDFFMQYLIPEVHLTIFKSSHSKTNPASVLVLPNNKKLPHNIHYTISHDKKTIKFGLSFEAVVGANNLGDITSILQCDRGKIMIMYNNPLICSDLRLSHLKLNCGQSYQPFKFSISKGDLVKNPAAPNFKHYDKIITL